MPVKITKSRSKKVESKTVDYRFLSIMIPVIITVITSVTTISTIALPRYMDYLEKKLEIEAKLKPQITSSVMSARSDHSIKSDIETQSIKPNIIKSKKSDIKFDDIFSWKNFINFITGKKQ